MSMIIATKNIGTYTVNLWILSMLKMIGTISTHMYYHFNGRHEYQIITLLSLNRALSPTVFQEVTISWATMTEENYYPFFMSFHLFIHPFIFFPQMFSKKHLIYVRMPKCVLSTIVSFCPSLQWSIFTIFSSILQKMHFFCSYAQS